MFGYTVQITHNLKTFTHVTHMSHAYDMCGVNHTCVGFLDNTRVYTRMQYLHMHMFVHACMLVWLMQLVSYLVSQLFTFQLKLKCYRFGYSVLSIQYLGCTSIGRKGNCGGNGSNNLILQLATSYLTEVFLLPEVTSYYTRCSAKFHH